MISKLLNVIKSYLYRFEKLSLPEQIQSGKFYVKYKDGMKSHSMDYKTAKHYAKMYDGIIINNWR